VARAAWTAAIVLAAVAHFRATFDDDTCRLEPIDHPVGPKVLPVCPE